MELYFSNGRPIGQGVVISDVVCVKFQKQLNVFNLLRSHHSPSLLLRHSSVDLVIQKRKEDCWRVQKVSESTRIYIYSF